MSDEKIFVDGMIVKRNENAPDFVICNLSLKGVELVAFMREHHKDGWLNIQVKRSKGGKYYAELDTWQPTQGQAATAGMAQAKQAAQPEPPPAAPDPMEDFSDQIPF
jgi:hypothetical protein